MDISELEVAVRNILEPVFSSPAEAKDIELFVKRFIHRVHKLVSVATDCQLQPDAKEALPLVCAKKLVRLLQDQHVTCVASLKVCQLTDFLQGSINGDSVWHGGVRCQFADKEYHSGHRPWLLLCWLTPVPHCPELFSHTPGSLFLQDQASSMLCEVAECRFEWIDNLVILPSWNFVSFRKMPALTRLGETAFDLVPGGYFELTSPPVTCQARPVLSLDAMPCITIEELCSVAAKPKAEKEEYCIRGNVAAISPVYRNLHKSPYFFIDLCSDEGEAVIVAIMTRELLHWVYLINVHEEIAVSGLIQSERRGTGEKVLKSQSTSKLASKAVRHQAVATPSCSSASLSLTNTPHPEQLVCAAPSDSGSDCGVITRSRRKRLSEASDDSCPSPRGTKRRRRGSEPAEKSASPSALSTALSHVTPVAKLAARKVPASTPKPGHAGTPRSKGCATPGDISIGGWTMDSQQLMELSQAMLEAERLGRTSPPTKPSPVVRSTSNHQFAHRGPSPLARQQLASTSPPLAKRPFSSTPNGTFGIPSAIEQSPIGKTRLPCPGTPACDASRSSCVERRCSTLPSSCEPFRFVSYEGVITSCENAAAGVFILDGRVRLQRAHQSCCQWCRGWRVGARVLLDNVHMLHTETENLKLVTLSCCSSSTVRVICFSLTTILTPPFFLETSPVAYYAWKLNCRQYSQYVELTQSLLKKFCPIVLKRERVVGMLVSSSEGEEKSGWRHKGVADAAVKALWSFEIDKTPQAPSHSSSPSLSPRQAVLKKRDPLVEFTSTPHSCGVIGEAFPRVLVPSIGDIVKQVHQLAYKRDEWYGPSGEVATVCSDQRNSVKWRYSVVKLAEDLPTPCALIGILQVSLHSGRLQLHDLSGHVDVVVASTSADSGHSDKSPCWLHDHRRTASLSRQASSSPQQARRTATLSCGVCQLHRVLPEHLNNIWCVRNAAFVVEEFSSSDGSDSEKASRTVSVYAVFSLADMDWLYALKSAHKHVKGESARHATVSSKSRTCSRGDPLVASTLSPVSGSFAVSHVKPGSLLLGKSGVVDLHASLEVRWRQPAAPVSPSPASPSFLALQGRGIHWYPVLHPSVKYHIQVTETARHTRLAGRQTVVDSADLVVTTDLSGDDDEELSTAAPGGRDVDEVLSVRDMLCAMNARLQDQSASSVEKVLSFRGVVVCRDVNAFKNTAEYKKESNAVPPPPSQQKRSQSQASTGCSAEEKSGERLMFAQGCGWIYSDVASSHGLLRCLQECFALLTVRDCRYLETVKVFMPLNRSPYVLAVLPGAVITVRHAVAKFACNGDQHIRITKGLTRVHVESVPSFTAVRGAQLSSSFRQAPSSRSYLQTLAQEWLRGVSNSLVHTLYCSVTSVQHVTVGMRCATCHDFLQGTCRHDDGKHVGHEAYAEARFIVDDGTAEGVAYAHDARVASLLQIGTTQWHRLLQSTIDSGTLTYQRSAFAPFRAQDGGGIANSSELDQLVSATSVYRQVTLHCTMLRCTTPAKAHETSCRFGKTTFSVAHCPKTLLRVERIVELDYQQTLVNLLRQLK